MLYSLEELDKTLDILEGDDAIKHLDVLDKMLGEDLPSISDMVETAISAYRTKRMYICNVIFLSEGEKVGSGLAIQLENSDGGYEVYSSHVCENGNIPKSLLEKVCELNYMGYELRTLKRLETIEIKIN